VYSGHVTPSWEHFRTRALRGRKPPPTPKFQPKVIRDSNSDLQINPNLYSHVCRICPKVLWMHYLVGISHFAKYDINRPLIVQEMLTNVQNRLFRNGEENEKVIWYPHADPDSSPKVNHFWRVTPCPRLPSLVDVAFVSYAVYRMTQKTTERSHKRPPCWRR